MSGKRNTAASMINYKVVFILAAIVCLSNITIAQTQQLKFNQIEGSNGITLGKVNAITQDMHGFTWFSDQTNRRIVRYDGNHMTQYKNDPNDPNSLGGYYPECLLSDPSGVIWIGFNGSGLDRFDPISGTFTHFRNDPNDTESLGNDYVNAICIDHLGYLWVGTLSGLDRMDPVTGTFEHFRHDANDPNSLSHDVIRAIYEDKEGTLWIGTGLPWNYDGKGGLNRMDRTTGTFTRYLHDPNDPNSLASNKVRALLEDSKGNFWVGTAGDGLHTLDRKTGKITRHPYDPKHPEKLSRPPLNAESGYDHITFIVEDAEEKIWIGTASNGLNRYDPNSQKVTHFGNDSDKSGMFKDNSGWCAYPTSDGMVWLGTQEDHLFKIDLFNITIPHIAMDAGAAAFGEGNSSQILLGNYAGLTILDMGNGTTRQLVHDPLNSNSLSHNTINNILKDHQGIIWIGTVDGLNRFDPQTEVFTHYFHDPDDPESLSESDITAIYEDGDLNLWVGTTAMGLNLLDIKTGKVRHYGENVKHINDIGNNRIKAIVGDKTDTLWIGLDNNSGVNSMDKTTGVFKQYLVGQTTNDLFIDSLGVLWVGTDNGLFAYNKTSDDFNPLSEKITGIGIKAIVMAIIDDDQDNLWINSMDGIYKLNKTRDELIRFDEENGLIIMDANRLYQASRYRADDGQLFFGYSQGYYAFYPKKLGITPDVSKLYFTSFWLNNRLIKPGSSGPLQQSIDDTHEILLDYDQNGFAFSFTSINYRGSKDNTISYTLENYDEEWRQSGMEDKVSYFKVPPGNYIFRIKALNSANGIWSEKNIVLNIAPPWWATWWAYTVYAILCVTSIFFVDRFQRKRLLQKAQAQAKEKELAQAKKIKKAYDELAIAHTHLKTTQTQLIQSEKMASLGELTAGIAHEIQNPLNFVNNFSELNTELLQELDEEATKGNLTEVKDLAKDIKANEEKINHHGKRAGEIVKGMLQHSRGSSGQKEPTDINSLADEYLRLAYHGLRAKDKGFNATMNTDFDKAIGMVNIVPQDMGRVILNLITNAFYAVNERKQQNPEGYEPTVSVGTKKSKGKIEISVKDNGNGIPQKILDKIFQPFFTTKPTGQGTGLGLSLAYDIIKAHGGELNVETSSNESIPHAEKEIYGTLFIISLPLNT
ncbi:MAG: ATP-binding protein [Maribacter sp.]|nr:ATP-binding protein [Maribacter sp.]